MPHSLVFFPQDILILVWELVKGMDVLDYLNSLGGVMTEPEARHFFRQLLSGIRCIHDNGFCHRDIKPENCMIEMNTGSLKIIDFGLSKHRDSAKTVGIGTPDYMSPEMLSRAGGVGGSEHASYDPEAVDVWAMGVMLYLILTGVYPFEDVSQPGNITATLRRVREGRMNKLPSNLSASVRDLLTRMIRVDPARRAKLAEISEHPWIVARETVGASGVAGQENIGVGGASWGGAPPGLAPINVGGACGSRRGGDTSAADAPGGLAGGQPSRNTLGGGGSTGSTFAGRIISRFFGSSSSRVG